jgi:hypothetical protein
MSLSAPGTTDGRFSAQMSGMPAKGSLQYTFGSDLGKVRTLVSTLVLM